MRWKNTFTFFSILLVALFLVQGKKYILNPDKTQIYTPVINTDPVVTIYSTLPQSSLQRVYEGFTKLTGLSVNPITMSAERLLDQLEGEGRYTIADIALTDDIATLQAANDKALLQWLFSSAVDQATRPVLKSHGKEWYALGKDVRLIAYAKANVKPDDISGYGDLALPQWRGKVLLSDMQIEANRSLAAAMMHELGIEGAKNWMQNLVINAARPPKGSDAEALKALEAGTGDIALINSSDYARLITSPQAEDQAIAAKIGVIIPHGNTNRAHVMISGIGIVASAQHSDNALKFLEFITSSEGQALLASTEYYYPANPAIAPSPALATLGSFVTDEPSAQDIIKHIPLVPDLARKAGWF